MGGSGPATFSKYDSQDLSKNPREFFKKGVSPHLREFEGRGPIIVLGTPLIVISSKLPRPVGSGGLGELQLPNDLLSLLVLVLSDPHFSSLPSQPPPSILILFRRACYQRLTKNVQRDIFVERSCYSILLATCSS